MSHCVSIITGAILAQVGRKKMAKRRTKQLHQRSVLGTMQSMATRDERGTGSLSTEQVERVQLAIHSLRTEHHIEESRGWQRELERATHGRLRQPTISTILSGRCGYNAARIVAGLFPDPEKKLVELLTGSPSPPLGRYTALSMRRPTLAPILDSLVLVYPVEFLDELSESEPDTDTSGWSGPDWLRWIVANWDARKLTKVKRK